MRGGVHVCVGGVGWDGVGGVGVGEVGWGGGVVVQSDGPRPPGRRHWGGTPVVVSSQTPERLQQRDNAGGGSENRALPPHTSVPNSALSRNHCFVQIKKNPILTQIR
jgi:hypothetical protein